MAVMTTAERLASALEAQHKLSTGTAVTVAVDQNGERVEFNKASLPRLKAYIEELRTLLANGDVVSSRRPMIPFF